MTLGELSRMIDDMILIYDEDMEIVIQQNDCIYVDQIAEGYAEMMMGDDHGDVICSILVINTIPTSNVICDMDEEDEGNNDGYDE